MNYHLSLWNEHLNCYWRAVNCITAVFCKSLCKVKINNESTLKCTEYISIISLSFQYKYVNLSGNVIKKHEYMFY